MVWRSGMSDTGCESAFFHGATGSGLAADNAAPPAMAMSCLRESFDTGAPPGINLLKDTADRFEAAAVVTAHRSREPLISRCSILRTAGSTLSAHYRGRPPHPRGNGACRPAATARSR